LNKPAETKYLEQSRELNSYIFNLDSFINNHNSLNINGLDYAIVHDLTLFSIDAEFDFDALDKNIKRIQRIFPHIKRIFSKPIIDLKDVDEVLPVEIAHYINQDSIHYLGGHPLDADDITAHGIKPRRILTHTSIDNYSIYENVIFCNFIDAILKYIRQNIRKLKNFLFTSESLQFNLLERYNHIDYFLAIGKLHTGYIRDFNRYYYVSKRLLNHLIFLERIINTRLKRPVYVNNRKRNKSLRLHKTNIFLMQKDYHQVYLTYKFFLKNSVIKEEDQTIVDFDVLKKNYFDFVELLTIFAVEHFNFEIGEKEEINLQNLNVSFKFKDWIANISLLNNKAIKLSIGKEKIYSFLLIPNVDETVTNENINGSLNKDFNETIICNPFIENSNDGKVKYISADNIDSFRRIQQLILKGMIYSDSTHNVCPFCGSELSFNSKTKAYECDSCGTVIKEYECNETHEKYYATSIMFFDKISRKNKASFNYDDNMISLQKESAMFFRNITEINDKLNLLCPKCGEIILDSKSNKQ
jgi:predicted RNA-binding Zn-ribbon protein involved in translation (DUF1610 family)